MAGTSEMMIDAALWHIGQGLHIFPVQDNEKTPHVTQEPYTIKWSDVASDDPGRVAVWWKHWPGANIGVACKPSRLLVVDCDLPKRRDMLLGSPYAYLHDIAGPLVDGEIVFDQVCQRFGGNWSEVQDTYRVSTGSGGTHYYYWWPEDIQASQASIIKGLLDIRCNGGERGGYVLGAGSRTESGPYSALPMARPIRRCPEWLVEVCRERKHKRPEPEGYHRPGIVNYQGLQDAVAYAAEGNRNNCLLWAARSMCSDGATEEEAQEWLGESASVAGLTTIETRDTIRSAYRLQGRSQ